MKNDILEYNEDDYKEIDGKYLYNLIETMEKTIIVLDDNKKITDELKFYDSKNLLYELKEHLEYLRGEK